MLEHFRRWQNPLIGWTSTADPLEHMARASLNFNTKEEVCHEFVSVHSPFLAMSIWVSQTSLAGLAVLHEIGKHHTMT